MKTLLTLQYKKLVCIWLALRNSFSHLEANSRALGWVEKTSHNKYDV
jgi:hypothetical protein